MPLRIIKGKDTEYDTIDTIGQGAFGVVTEVRRRDGKIMACKTIKCHNSQIVNLAVREIEVWASFGNKKYIASFSDDLSWNESTKTLRIYMEFYEGGDLRKVISGFVAADTKIHPFIVCYWGLEIARAIETCHSNLILHRDIKPENVLLDRPYRYNDMLWEASNGETLDNASLQLAKEFLQSVEEGEPWCHLTDFGLGKFSVAAVLPLNTAGTAAGMGTPGFIAPEALGRNPEFCARSDVYSLGCLLYNLCRRRFVPQPQPERWRPADQFTIPDCYPPRLQALIQKCLEFNAAERPSSYEVVKEFAEIYDSLIKSEFWSKTKSSLQGQPESALMQRVLEEDSEAVYRSKHWIGNPVQNFVRMFYR